MNVTKKYYVLQVKNVLTVQQRFWNQMDGLETVKDFLKKMDKYKNLLLPYPTIQNSRKLLL